MYNSFTFFRSVFLLALSPILLMTHHWILVWLLIWSNMVSFTYAVPSQHPFPNILFSTFSDTIQSNFGQNVTLATVLAILFILVENLDLLNLHFRQQNPQYSGENRVQVSGWMIALVNALVIQLGNRRTETLFSENELENSEKGKPKFLAEKLNLTAISLKLSPYDSKENYNSLYHIIRLNQPMLFVQLHLYVGLWIASQDV